MATKVTVLMTVYNGETYLKECINSVLAQTYKDFEFLIIDDKSTDSTPGIIASYNDTRIRLLKNEKNLSQVTSLNKGLDHASGEYIARIDADDVMLPNRLERQLHFLTKRPDIELIGSWGEAIDEKGRSISRSELPSRNEEIIATILFGGFISLHSSFMFRKKTILELGKYNEAFSFTEDYRLIIDLLLKGHKVANIPKALIQYRLHNDRISVRSSKPQIERSIIASKEFVKNFSRGFSEEDVSILFNFLMSAGSMKNSYWDSVSRSDIKNVIGLSDLLLNNVLDYFKLVKKENYFIKKVYYKNILNFTYQALNIKKVLWIELYLYCLKNCFFILEKPKLYLCPLMALSLCLGHKR